GKIKSVKINAETHHPEIVILAIGNAARDTFNMLSEKISLASKPFAVGFRIEHPQDYLNETFYGSQTDFQLTGPATYRLTARAGKRGVYSFCMCPGGEVIAAASEKNAVVTNGMSLAARNGKFGNSAIVVTVNETDFGKGILDGMRFQSKIEQKCFNSDQPYLAPMQAASDFLKSIPTKRKIATSYQPGVFASELTSVLSPEITEAIKIGLIAFERQAKGFIRNGVFLAPETRTSCPLRIMRDQESFHSITLQNLYPCGEGSGYAGGIMSSAADGFKIGSIFSL
ncbi:MAG TPA: hypothetical protein PLD62_08845, partial [Candidatus Cloacimonadota bacterium]|nr:hypothetical protein [Candidatus Cloacimonadota bacterium]